MTVDARKPRPSHMTAASGLWSLSGARMASAGGSEGEGLMAAASAPVDARPPAAGLGRRAR